MNEKHIFNVNKSIREWTNGTRTRVKQSFEVSQKQFDLLVRITEMRKRVSDLPTEMPLYVFGSVADIRYLFKYTSICEKNIRGIVTEDDITLFYDVDNSDYEYQVIHPNEDKIKEIDCIVSAKLGRGDDYREYGYSGEWIYLYDTDTVIPFYCINSEGGPIEANSYYFDIVRRVDKINEKLKKLSEKRVVVYCAGVHTELLFRYTNVVELEISSIVDKKVREMNGIPVEYPSDDILENCDYILISSYGFQKEIYKELSDRGFEEKAFLLYDDQDANEFFRNENTFSPDRPYIGEFEGSMSSQDAYAEAERCMQEISKNSDLYATYSIIDNKRILESSYYRGENEIWKAKGYETDNSRCAIILQGPIVYEDDFTVDSVRLYQRLYPGANIIVSTWESEKENPQICRIKEYADVIFSRIPEERGVLNINFQIKSTVEGIRAAKRHGAEYALKTRTDFRLHSPGVLSYLVNSTINYPAKSDKRKRLCVLQPKLDAPYFIPDFVTFGTVEEMLRFWEDKTIFPQETGGKNPEMLLFSRYMKLIGCYVEDPLNNMDKYIDKICEEFIVTDPLIYRYIWRKYSYENEIMMVEGENLLTASDWFIRQVRAEK